MHLDRAPGARLGLLCAGAVALGAAARLYLALARPVWADEAFTLELARRPVSQILAMLRVDSGPPLHYLVSRIVLLPLPTPGDKDVVVRLLAVLLSILHIPLLLVVARRLGRASDGPVAAMLFSVIPLAVWYGSEGRGYALASLLVLMAFERSLKARETGGAAPAVIAGLAAAGALLSHYLAVFPLLGVTAALLPGTWRQRRLHALSAVVAGAALVPWAGVALTQPRASLRWVVGVPAWEAAPRVLSNVLLGADAEGLAGVLLGAAAAFATGLLLLSAFRQSVAAVAILSGTGILLLAGLAAPELLLPERCGVPFLSLSALALAALPVPARLAAGTAGAALTAVSLAAWTAPTPSSDLADRLLSFSRPGERVVAAGLWGPELRYRFARAGRPDAVLLFPSEIARHPGWYSEEGGGSARLKDEASALPAGSLAPTWWVLPRAQAASTALRHEARRRGAREVAATPLYELWRSGPGGG